MRIIIYITFKTTRSYFKNGIIPKNEGTDDLYLSKFLVKIYKEANFYQEIYSMGDKKF